MQDDRYSQIVGWLKILLPLGALALLSTMFLFARAPLPAGEIPYAEIEDIARDPRMVGPVFAGVTDDGATVSLTAETIRPQPEQPDTLDMADFRVVFETPAGETIEVAAVAGRFDGQAQTVLLEGLARLVSSSGYQMETTGLTANLALGRVETLGPLEVRAPAGQLEAGKLTVTEGGARLVFNGGVRLLYHTGPQEEPQQEAQGEAP